jgi:hypothetical protein
MRESKILNYVIVYFFSFQLIFSVSKEDLRTIVNENRELKDQTIKIKADLTENLLENETEIKNSEIVINQLKANLTREIDQLKADLKSEKCKRNPSLFGLVNYWPVRNGRCDWTCKYEKYRLTTIRLGSLRK